MSKTRESFALGTLFTVIISFCRAGVPCQPRSGSVLLSLYRGKSGQTDSEKIVVDIICELESRRIDFFISYAAESVRT